MTSQKKGDQHARENTCQLKLAAIIIQLKTFRLIYSSARFVCGEGLSCICKKQLARSRFSDHTQFAFSAIRYFSFRKLRQVACVLRGTHMSIDVIRAAKEFRLPHRQYLFLPSVDCFCLPHLFNLQIWGSILQIRKSRKKERKKEQK